MSSDGLQPAGRGQRRLSRASDESGQILVLTALSLVLMLVSVGLVVDVGHAMLVQRQLQAGVDAGALAGVQHLPDATAAETTAVQYSATPGSKNAVNTVNNALTTAKVSCLAGVPGCSRRDGGVNGITVVSKSDVPTWFGRIIGLNQMSVSAKAVACSPCSVKPLDVMIVIDRTGSMCQPAGPNGSCPDLDNAKDGVRTFLGFLDPSLDKVGLAFTPPVRDPQFISKCPYTPWQGTSNPNPTPPGNIDGKYFGYDSFWPHVDPADPLPGWNSAGRVWANQGGQGMSDPSNYVVASMEGADGTPADDYIIFNPVTGDWDLNPASAVVQRLGCAQSAGSTSYALSIEEAQHELEAHGRGPVQDVIIFLSDGAANTSPTNLPTSHWTNDSSHHNRPCGTGVEAAAWSKSRGTVIYTIGYDVGTGATSSQICQKPNAAGHQSGSTPEVTQSWGNTAYDAIRAMATSPAHFYIKPVPGQLNTIFTQIAIDLAGSRGRLVDSNPNLLAP